VLVYEGAAEEEEYGRFTKLIGAYAAAKERFKKKEEELFAAAGYVYDTTGYRYCPTKSTADASKKEKLAMQLLRKLWDAKKQSKTKEALLVGIKAKHQSEDEEEENEFCEYDGV